MLRIAGTDLETTGFLEPTQRIIEACVITYEWDGEKAREVDSYTQRINPGRPIEPGASKVHGISDTDLIGKPSFVEVAPTLFKKLDGVDVCVGHNLLEFDGPFLIQEFERVRHAIPEFEPYDTMVEGRWATEMGMVPSLGALCFACGVDYDKSLAHSATYDVRVMMSCFFFGLTRGVYKLPKKLIRLVA